MLATLNETHDPQAASWLETANAPSSDFPLQNLPLGVFVQAKACPAIGVAIGDQVLDLAACASDGLLSAVDAATVEACREPSLSPLMGLGAQRWSALRRALFALLRAGAANREETRKRLFPIHEAKMLLPARIGNYTDFYASIFHARNVGSMFRPDNPLLPNYEWIPIAYHGRASSVVPSGTAVRRPQGQSRAEGRAAPDFGPTRMLDYELEVGALIGPGNELGSPIEIENAGEHLFGLCLVNDWSARDIQAWEYQPLGPFLGKNFATSISPWVVTAEALAPFRIPAYSRQESEAFCLPHLWSNDDQTSGGLDLTLEVWLSSKQMREQKQEPVRLSRGNYRTMYWTFAQMIAHHTSGGCNLQPGDLLASGTASGPTPDSRGCLLELTWRGKEPLLLPSGEHRKFLEDGDEVILRGYCEREGARRIGFGECRGTIEY